jgi:hypothetical protein
MTAIYIIGVIGALVALFFLWRSRNGWPPLPAWTWHDIRKLVALWFTIMGAAVVTLIAWWLLDELVTMAKGLIGEYLNTTRATAPPREVGVVLVKVIDVLAWGLKLLLAGSIVVLLSLGFAINPRSFEFAGPGGFKGGFKGGDSEPPEVAGAKQVAQAAEREAADIEAQAEAKPAEKPDLPEYAR